MSKRSEYKTACQRASEEISSVVPRDVVESLMQAADAYIEELEQLARMNRGRHETT